LSLLACSSISSTVEDPTAIPGDSPTTGGDALTVAVMPFVNETEEPELESLLRKSFYNHFSSKTYRDIELSAVDRGLAVWEKENARSWKALSTEELGDLLQTDIVIYGKVQDYEKLFMGIYSQISMKAQIEMVNCTSGEGIWWKTLVKRSHDGGVPFDLFGIVPAALRSGFHMKKERTLDLIDRINRDLMKEIPTPSASPLPDTVMDIQVASFLDESLAQGLRSELKDKGFSSRIETVVVKDRIWRRVLIGPFHRTEEARKVRKQLEERTPYQPILLHHGPEPAPEKEAPAGKRIEEEIGGTKESSS
jgi:TolB-like protein